MNGYKNIKVILIVDTIPNFSYTANISDVDATTNLC
ncbi:MAG: hypothetical protein C5S43_00440 [Candidatus Methanocomedens sp.]|nr:MAG: hypothetical protein C5S43_00440 [ANME-2 cluster archaeon]